MSTTPDTRYTDDIIQAAIDEAFDAANCSPLTAVKDSPSWRAEAPARLSLARALLARLPEPTPPSADGKTPGQVNHDAVANGDYDTYKKWSELSERGKRDVERGASAVLATFGGQASLEAGIERMEAVPMDEIFHSYDHKKGVTSDKLNAIRARLIAAAREGQPAPAVEAEPVKPWTLPPPPEGQQWHRTDWTEDMLPEGWRPLLLKERWVMYDEILRNSSWEVAGADQFDWLNSSTMPETAHCRTRRPLPQPPVLAPSPQPWQPASQGGTTMKFQILIACLAAPIPSVLWFLGGYDFNERGAIAVALGITTLFCIIAPLTFPRP